MSIYSVLWHFLSVLSFFDTRPKMTHLIDWILYFWQKLPTDLADLNSKQRKKYFYLPCNFEESRSKIATLRVPKRKSAKGLPWRHRFRNFKIREKQTSQVPVRSFVEDVIKIHPSVWAVALSHTYTHIHTHTHTHIQKERKYCIKHLVAKYLTLFYLCYVPYHGKAMQWIDGQCAIQHFVMTWV